MSNTIHKFEKGKRYRVSKEKFHEELGFHASWVDEDDGKEVTVINENLAKCGKDIIVSLGCEEIKEEEK